MLIRFTFRGQLVMPYFIQDETHHAIYCFLPAEYKTRSLHATIGSKSVQANGLNP
jgi:hypothetical protein